MLQVFYFFENKESKISCKIGVPTEATDKWVKMKTIKKWNVDLLDFDFISERA